MQRRKILAAALAVAASAIVATASAQNLPSYYPKSYSQIVEGSKKENKLVVYSIMAEYNWKPVVEGFRKLYPWIEVQTLDLGSSEVFERYYSERASGARTVEIMADFTNWEPVSLTPGAAGFEHEFALGAGTHRAVVRIDGGSWRPATNTPAVDDDLGGRVGLLVVP